MLYLDTTEGNNCDWTVNITDEKPEDDLCPTI